ncbi:hypothetical protein F5887DRAFT_1091833 [Amanita rubescens]|nr:hypothetical protein F5887DRAFT_1091833 [Amanita rubescens]
MFIRVMRQANTVILEGVKNVPLALIYALDYVQCLDLAQIKLAPMTPQDAIAPNTIPRAAPQALSIHTRIEDDWEDNESDGTLRTDATGCAQTWKEAIALCKNTLVSLKLTYYPEGDGELIDLSAMGALRDLDLSVVAHPLSIMYLVLLLNSLSVPTTHLLKLGLFIDDRNLAREVDWLAVVSRERASLAQYGKIMDAKLYHILKRLRGYTKILESLLPHTSPEQQLTPGKVNSALDPKKLSLSPHIRASIGM